MVPKAAEYRGPDLGFRVCVLPEQLIERDRVLADATPVRMPHGVADRTGGSRDADLTDAIEVCRPLLSGFLYGFADRAVQVPASGMPGRESCSEI